MVRDKEGVGVCLCVVQVYIYIYITILVLTFFFVKCFVVSMRKYCVVTTVKATEKNHLRLKKKTNKTKLDFDP